MSGRSREFSTEILEGGGGGAWVEIPFSVERVLASEPEARALYEGLSYTHRREYAEWVGEAKRQETRDRRASKAVEMLRGGKRL